MDQSLDKGEMHDTDPLLRGGLERDLEKIDMLLDQDFSSLVINLELVLFQTLVYLDQKQQLIEKTGLSFLNKLLEQEVS